MASSKLTILAKEGLRVALIMGAGDVIAQAGVNRTPIKDLDFKRTAKFAAIGFFYMCPALRGWYGWLDRTVKPQKPFVRGLKKMLLDQLTFAPVFTLSMFYVIGLANGESIKQIGERVRSDYTTVLANNYLLWPPAQIINFSLVPIQYQVIFVQFVALIWNTYMSWKLNQKK